MNLIPVNSPQPAAQAAFDALYAQSPDPWQVQVRWYEQRKRAITVASLSRARYDRALELGCSNGELTAALMPRCQDMVACDLASVAVDAARLRLSEFDGVSVEQRMLPDEWPEGRFDLVVMSEFGYFLTPEALHGCFDAISACLSDDGEVLVCHWLHPIVGYPLSGIDVHRHLRAWAIQAGLHHRVKHEEADFILECWSRDSLSVAQREGIV